MSSFSHFKAILRLAVPAIFALLALPPLSANTDWRVLPIRSQSEFDQGMIGGEAEQHLHSMARCLTHPNVLYLSQDVAGTWRSIDGGHTWQKTLDIGLYLDNGQSIAVDPYNPNIIFIEVDNTSNYRADASEGLYRSIDGGDHWERVLATSTNYDRTVGRSFRQAIACDPSSTQNQSAAQRWYAAFPNNGLYRSDNAGLDFGSNPLSSLTGHQVIFDLSPVPASDTIFLASDLGLFASHTSGTNLQAIGNLPSGPVTSIAVDPRDPNRVWATVRNIGLFQSTDAGLHFSLIKSFNVTRLFTNPGFPDTLYLIGSTHTITSHDGGQSWIENAFSIADPETGLIRSGTSMEVEGELAGLAPNPLDPNEAVGYAKASIWKTTDGGQSFSDSSTLFTGYAWSWWNRGAAFDRFDPQRFAFFNNDVGMTLTTNGGDSFENRNPNAWAWYQSGLISWIGTYAGDFQPIAHSTRLVAAIGGYFNTQLMTSDNLGSNWSLLADSNNLDQSLDKNLFVAFHPNDPNFVYAGDKISTDGGIQFTHIDFANFNEVNPYLVGFCEAQPDTVYAISNSGTIILRSDNRASTWQLYAHISWSTRPFDSIPTFAVDPEDPDIIYTLDSVGDLARFDGNNWTSLHVLDLVESSMSGNSYYNYVRTVTVDPNNHDILYAGMFSSGIDCLWRSTDQGASWTNITGNFPRIGVSTLAVNPHTGELFTGTLAGTWILPPPYPSSNLIYDKATPRPVGVPLSPTSFDAWRLSQFSWDAFNDLTVSGPSANSDGDIWSNFAEYALGHDPKNPDASSNSTQVILEKTKTQSSYSFQITQRTGDPSLLFELQTSTDLISWTNISDTSTPELTITSIQPTPLTDDLSIYRYQITENSISTPTRFFRIHPTTSVP